jgi:hypothetical protein
VRNELLVFLCLSGIAETYLVSLLLGTFGTWQLTFIVEHLAQGVKEIEILLFPRQCV